MGGIASRGVVRTGVIVLCPPVLQLTTSISNRADQIHSQTFIPEDVIESLHMGLVWGLPWATEFNADVMIIYLGVQRIGGEHKFIAYGQ